MALGISMAAADEVRSHEFKADQISNLNLEVRSGHVVIEHHDDDNIYVEVRFSADDEGWFRRTADLSKTDIAQSFRNQTLTLGFDQKGVNTEWVIYIPVIDQVEVNLGVGAVELDIINSDISVNIGVGAVEMSLPLSHYGEIGMTAGIGETTLTGARSVQSNRALLASNLNGEGEGDRQVSVNLGVGSGEINLTRVNMAGR